MSDFTVNKDIIKDLKDYSSLSNYDEITVKHQAFELEVDFDKSTLSGTGTYTIEASCDGVSEVVLDTRDLTVRGVTASSAPTFAPTACSFTLSPHDECFGRALKIALPQALSKGGGVVVMINFSTSPNSSAIQWLPPEQTAGKKYPYLFTQCQAIHARSMVPCIDAPGHKSTYSASVTAPAWATVLMSAVPDGEPSEVVDGKRVHKWSQPQACSSYLIAMAVGELEKRDISERCCVWSEPSMVEAVRYEFDDTESFLQVAESLAGPYKWGRYDVLCLPPSFPFGGMENPCLTFVTPTLLAGDRSLADVVAHEIAHSWTGNLVTNATWTHFWLNEGWTRWFECTIMVEMQKDERYFDLRASLGYDHFREDVERYLKDGEDGLTCLVPPLEGIDPDDSFSSVPYEKGLNLLLHLQKRVGKKDFHKFFRAYVDEFSSKVVDTAAFQAFFENYFAGREEVAGFDWEPWTVLPGLLPVDPNYDLALLAPLKALAKAWATTGAGLQGDEYDFLKWESILQQLFLQELLDICESSKLPPSTLEALDAAYSLTGRKNSELRFKWVVMCMRCGYTPQSIIDDVVNFATTQGRMKFTRPLYRELVLVAPDLAVSTFEAHKNVYHPICKKMVKADLDKATSGATSGGGGGGGGGVMSAATSDRTMFLIGIGVAVAAAAAFVVFRKRA